MLSVEIESADCKTGGKLAMQQTLSETLFLQHTATELKTLEETAQTHYHGLLVRMLSAARLETEMLLREETQVQTRPRRAEQALDQGK
jgi:hypothetical protein